MFQVLPRHVEALGPDEREDLALLSILADQGRREAQPPPGLQVCHRPEDGGGEQVDLVVDDQAPVLLTEELEVFELVGLRAAPGEHLVGRDRHRADLLVVAGVLPHLLLGQLGLVEQLLAPLPDRDCVRGQDQGLGPDQAHDRHARDRLAGSAGQDDNAAAAVDRAAGVEGGRRVLLVGPQGEGVP